MSGRSKPPTHPVDSGVFREALLKWFEDSDYDLSLRQAGRMLAKLTADLHAEQTEPSPQGRLRAIVVDLIFLVGYLQEEVDVRAFSSLEPRDEELAREAAAIAASLLAQVETLIVDLGLKRDTLILPSDWEDFVGLRETALPAHDETGTSLDIQGLRTLTELVYRYGLEVQSSQQQGDETPTARSLRAAVTDLRRLAETTRNTTHHLPAAFSGPLATLTRNLLSAAAELTHALAQGATGEGEIAH